MIPPSAFNDQRIACDAALDRATAFLCNLPEGYEARSKQAVRYHADLKVAADIITRNPALTGQKFRIKSICKELLERCFADGRDQYLTVAMLKEALEGVDDFAHVVIVSPDWYVNIAEVILPGQDDHVAVTLVPGSDFDTRQI